MYIEKVVLQNFRNLKGEKTFNFSKGVNLFYGGNFAGKSTIHKAIALCLNINDSDNKNMEEYINDESEFFAIDLYFSHEGKDFLEKIHYSRSGKNSKRELYIDDFTNPAYNTASTVKEYLSKVIDPTLGEHALFMMQDNLSIINAKDSERLDLFKKIRNINFKKQADDLDLEIKKIKDEDLKTLEINLVALSQKKYEETPILGDKYSSEDIIQFQERISILDKKINEIENAESQKKELQSKVNSLQAELRRVEEEIESIGKSIESKKSLISSSKESTESDIEAIEEAIAKLETSLNEEVDKSSMEEAHKEEVSIVEKSLSEKETEYSSINIQRKRWESFDTEIDSLKNEKSILLADKSTYERTLSACSEGKCPTCGKDFESKDEEKYKGIIKNIESNISSIETKLKDLLDKKEAQEKEKIEQEQLSTKKTLLGREIESLKEKKEALEKNYEEKVKQVEGALEEKKNFTKSLIEEKKASISYKKETLEKSVKGYESDITELEQRLSSNLNKKTETSKTLLIEEEKLSSFEVEDSQKLTEEKNSLTSKIDEQKEINSHNNIAKETNKKLEKEKEKDALRKVEMEKEKDRLNQEIEYRVTARKILLKDFPNFIIQQTIQDVEDKMNMFVEKIHDKGMNLKLHGTATSLKFLCGENKDRLRDVRSTSGAEKFLIALGFVNIFNQELELNCIFLDEVDQAMNENNTKKLFDIIQGLPFEQLFIITHNKVLQASLIEDGAKSFEFIDGKVIS